LCARGAGFETERHATQDGRHLWFCGTHSGERWSARRREAAGIGDAVGGKTPGERKASKRKASKKAGARKPVSQKTHATNATNPVADPGTANVAGPDAEVARRPEAVGAEAVETEA
jgi:hypothetical protein